MITREEVLALPKAVQMRGGNFGLQCACELARHFGRDVREDGDIPPDVKAMAGMFCRAYLAGVIDERKGRVTR